MLKKTKKWIRSVITSYSTITLTHKYVVENELYKGKVVVIISTTGDIGLLIAKKFLQQGAQVVLAGGNIDGIETLKSKDCYIVNCNDIKSEVGSQKFCECLNVFGKIDIWVNCIIYMSPDDLNGGFFDVTEDDWDLQMEINCKELYFLTQEVGRYYYENGINGHIVQVLSMGEIQNAWRPYGIFKRVAVEFTRGIAKALAPYHIVVNGVISDYVQTKTHEKQPSTLDKERNISLSHKEEIVNIVCFLSSDMADHMVGSLIVCDRE